MSRVWIPSAYVDEITPPGRSTPDDWIATRLGDVCAIASCESDRPADWAVSVGQVIGFHCRDDFEDVEIQIERDGTSRVLNGSIDSRATHFYLACDPDSLASSMEEFVKQYVANDPDHDGAHAAWPRRETVGVSWWSDELPHMLTINQDGQPHFAMTAAGRSN